MDVERRVLFTNARKDFIPYWDFKVEATQQLIVVVKVHDDPNSNPDMLASGCVAIMFGLKTD